MPDVKLLTPRDVAAALNVKLNWVYDHAKELGGVRFGRLLRFRADRIAAVQEQGLSAEE